MDSGITGNICEFLGRDHLSLLTTAMNCLLFPVSPACPDQHCSVATGEPSVPRRALCRQRYPNVSIVKVLFCMMIDRSPQRLKIGARTTDFASLLYVGTALGGGYLGQHLIAPIIVQSADAPFKLRLVRHPRSAIFEIDRQHVGKVDPVYVACAAGG